MKMNMKHFTGGFTRGVSVKLTVLSLCLASVMAMNERNVNGDGFGDQPAPGPATGRGRRRRKQPAPAPPAEDELRQAFAKRERNRSQTKRELDQIDDVLAQVEVGGVRPKATSEGANAGWQRTQTGWQRQPTQALAPADGELDQGNGELRQPTGELRQPTKSYKGEKIAGAIFGLGAAGCGAFIFSEQVAHWFGHAQDKLFTTTNPGMWCVIGGGIFVLILLGMFVSCKKNNFIVAGGLALGGFAFSASALTIQITSMLVSVNGQQLIPCTGDHLYWTIGLSAGVVIGAVALGLLCWKHKCLNGRYKGNFAATKNCQCW